MQVRIFNSYGKIHISLLQVIIYHQYRYGTARRGVCSSRLKIPVVPIYLSTLIIQASVS